MDFQLYGRSYHPVIRTAADLREACLLDEGLWVATSAPISAFRVDPVLLKYLDNDQDQRIKCGEMTEAIQWTLAVLKDTSAMDQHSGILNADHLNPDHSDARKISELLSRIAPDSRRADLTEIRDWRKRLENRPVSESGVVLPGAAEEKEADQVLTDILSVLPGVDHPSGAKGMDRDTLKTFFTLRDQQLAWWDRRNDQDDLGRSIVLPLGEQTANAFAALEKVRPAIDRYFQLCDAVALDSTLLSAVWPGLPKDLNWEDPEAVQNAMRNAPLAAPKADGVLQFDSDLNPAWTRDLHAFRQNGILPLLDRTDNVLPRDIWKDICKRLDPYREWTASEPSPAIAALGEERLRTLDPDIWIPKLTNLIDHQQEAAVSLGQVRLAEKLALFQAHLLDFANNFIAFPFLYDPVQRAGFEMGTLIMDARRFSFSIRVPDRASYIKNIADGTMFIMILELVHTQRNEKMDVAVPATWGQQGNLKVGKHGIFQHVDGSEWFATVVHITDNPISLREAMLEPFKRLGAAVTKKVESITQTAEKKLDQTGSEAVTQLQAAPAAPAAAPAGNALAGGGIAIAAVGSSLAFITKIFAELQFVGILKGVLAAVLAVLIPSMIIAWLRLRKRDLSILLEGAGWAINARMRLNVTQSRSFTRTPAHPEGSKLLRPNTWWLWRIALIAALLNIAVRTMGWL